MQIESGQFGISTVNKGLQSRSATTAALLAYLDEIIAQTEESCQKNAIHHIVLGAPI